MLFSNLLKQNLNLIVLTSTMKRTTSGRIKPVSKVVKSETVNKNEDDVHEVRTKRSISKVVNTQKIDENEEEVSRKTKATQDDRDTRVSQRIASNTLKSQTATKNEDDEPKEKISKKSKISKIMKSDQDNENKDSKPKTLKSKMNDGDKDAKQNPSTSQSALEGSDFVERFQKSRLTTAESILDFDFKKKRVRVLSKTDKVKENADGGILYWMFRDMRVQDNWAFLFAQKLALKNHLPLHVCFCLLPNFLNATIRHYKFLMKGLQEVEDECHELNIKFHLFHGTGPENIPKFIENNSIGALVCDLSPLNLPKKWVEDVKNNIPSDIPFCLVDSHNIVPVWIASDKQEYAARTIRNKINTNLKIFLTKFPPLIKHPYLSKMKYDKIDWNSGYKFIKCDQIIDEVEWAKPGYRSACKELQNFCEKRLKIFHDKRNNPIMNALSNLSPWFHFGNISVQRCILTVNKYKTKYPESVAAFCEEAIVRRELSENFCYYNKNYDNLEGISSWALKTLNDHRKDKRDNIYELKEFEDAKTHDDLWNSAQIQLIKEGKMHGFLRMYWAKKILEWTESPEKALEIAIYLNDKYNLDGRDPNGYVGCMWSIGGVHDQGWSERPIFGKIRYMNYQGCKRKFDVAAFVARYGGKVYKKK